jgi:EmrB/QacA subfamily drug resistance transporter
MNSEAPKEVNRWEVLVIVMMGTFMAILDSSIVNVALPHMMSYFQVNRDQIEWVATAFLLASAVTMPLVGWLVGKMGLRTLYLTSLALFTIGSAACAFAWSYHALIIARIVQAVGGGAIQPAGMAIVANMFAPRERGKALGIWGTGIMIGPTLGPTLGGYLTETYSWREIFSVNLPFGVLTLLAGLVIMRGEILTSRKKILFDPWGFIFLSMFLIAGLVALANGQIKGWDSEYIRTALVFTFIGFVMFIASELTVKSPLLDLRLFFIRNFSLSIVLAIFRAVGLFGGLFLLPLFLQNLMGYSALRAGLIMMPGALAVGLTMPIAGNLSDRYNPRWLVVFGTTVTGISLLMYGNLDPISTRTMILSPLVIRGVGLAFMMAPLMTTAINSVPMNQVATASSFLNITQSIGGSFGITLLNTLVTDSIQRHSVVISEFMSPQSDTYRRFIHHLSEVMYVPFNGIITSDNTVGMAVSLVEIGRRAQVMGFQNGFVIGGIIVLAGIPLCLLLTKSIPRAKT